MCEEQDGVNEACSVMEAVNRISGKWTVGILLAATEGPVRFTELERHLKGISRRMLTLTLRNLERDGLLRRTVHPTVPPKVEYEATDMARELHSALAELVGWARRNRANITRSRTGYDDTAGELVRS
ncbi:MAG TPA: helix-turn-helix domain-containing protein [Pseudonocardiaceae bacterium]|jgi:DNA-binding HxlR family transcriptional regulator|nr:helix-turn-helix domain-containing protein [Pseudonocardiaceae bacterium]